MTRPRAAPGDASRAAESALAALPVLRALAEPHRLSLVHALRERERCVRDLVEAVGLSQPLVSFHLSKLVEAGLVQSRHGDGFTYYALRAAGLRDAQAMIGTVLAAELTALAQPGGNGACCR